MQRKCGGLAATLMCRFMASMRRQGWYRIVKQVERQKLPVKEGLMKFAELLGSEPKDLNMYARYVGLLYRHKQLLEIPEHLDQLQRLAPKSSLPSIFKALVFTDLGQKPNAAELWGSVDQSKTHMLPVEKLYSAVLLRKLGKTSEALIMLDQYLESEEGEGDIEAIYEKIRVQSDSRMHDEVLAAVDKHIAKDPFNLELRYLQALAFRGLNKITEAFASFTLILESNPPDELKAVCYLARSKCRPVNDIEGAVADLREADKLDPKLKADKEILLRYYFAQKLDMAETHLTEIEKKHNINEDYSLLVVKGSILRYLKQDYTAALLVYKRIVDLAPEQYKKYFQSQVTLIL